MLIIPNISQIQRNIVLCYAISHWTSKQLKTDLRQNCHFLLGWSRYYLKRQSRGKGRLSRDILMNFGRKNIIFPPISVKNLLQICPQIVFLKCRLWGKFSQWWWWWGKGDFLGRSHPWKPGGEFSRDWRFLRSPPIEGTNIFLSFLQNLDILDQVLGVLDYIGTLFKNHRHVPPSLPFRCLDGDIV